MKNKPTGSNSQIQLHRGEFFFYILFIQVVLDEDSLHCSLFTPAVAVHQETNMTHCMFLCDVAKNYPHTHMNMCGHSWACEADMKLRQADNRRRGQTEKGGWITSDEQDKNNNEDESTSSRLQVALPSSRGEQTFPPWFLQDSAPSQRYELAAACWPLLISSPPPFGKEQLAGDIPAKLGRLSLCCIKTQERNRGETAAFSILSIRGLNNHRNFQEPLISLRC